MTEQLIKYIRTLIPLCDIKKENNQKDLLKHILLGRMKANKTLFLSGKNNEFTFYLLSGQLTLIDALDNKTILTSDDPCCRFPIGYDQSNKYTVKTNTTINYLKINNQILDDLLTWDQTTTPLLRHPEKRNVDENEFNWMSKILELELFQRIPAENIQAMFLRFETIQADKESVIVEQDAEADYYYVIKSGKAAVFRSEQGHGSSLTKLAELSPGETFGEEALVADSLRNASIIMQEDGELARLSKADFVELLQNPVMKSITYEEALAMSADGAQLIDVRTENEYKHNHLANSINIPLYSIRDKLDSLDNTHVFIMYCDTGSRSASACYILNERGFLAYFLEKGLNTVSPEAVIHPEKD